MVPVLVGLFVTACSPDPDRPTGSGGSTTGSGTSTGEGGSGVGGGPGGTGGSAAPTGPFTGRVKRYEYAFDLATRHAKSQLQIDVAAPGGDCFQTGSELATVTNATWNGAPAKSAAVTSKRAFGKGKPEWPTLAVSTAQTGNTVTVTVAQKNASKKLYGCKVEVEVLGATTTVMATIDFGAAPKSDTATATVTLSEPVVGTTLEPRHRLVARLAKAGVPAAPEPLLPIWPL